MTVRSAEIVVVGSLNLDLVVTVERLPAPGETLMGDAFATHHGGKGGNQAVAAARLGARVAMIGCVGADDAGKRLVRALADEGIDVDGIAVDATSPTGTALITVDRSSRNTIVVVSGSNAALDLEALEQHDALLSGAHCVVCQLEIDEVVTLDALSRARLHGVRTIFNPAPAPIDPSAWRNRLDLIDLLVLNETEAELFSGVPVRDVDDAHAAAEVLIDSGARAVILTLGAEGLIHGTADGTRHHVGVRVQAVDSTAAGDTFIGALAAALVAGRSDVEAIQFAQRAAALSVTRRGAQASIPTLDELRDWPS